MFPICGLSILPLWRFLSAGGMQVGGPGLRGEWLVVVGLTTNSSTLVSGALDRDL